MSDLLRRLYLTSAVYPISALLFVALSLTQTAQFAGLYSRICTDEFRDDPRVDCSRLSESPEAEDWVQKAVTQLRMYITIATLIPASFTGRIHV